MSTLTFSEAFAKYDSKLANPMWAFSAKAADGSIVLSCWSHKFSYPAKGVMRYADRLSRWRVNTPGKNLLISHITEAHSSTLPVRLIIATTSDPAVVDAGEDASKIALLVDAAKRREGTRLETRTRSNRAGRSVVGQAPRARAAGLQ